MSRASCLKDCLRKKIAWFIGGSIISALVSALIALGVLIPAAGTIGAILIGLGLLAFVAISAVIYCLVRC